MTSYIQQPLPGPCPPETQNMTAHDLNQVDFMKMDIQGEGNYASTVFSNTRDQETVQGLTLSPKIQSTDQWLFDAAGVFGDQDLDDLLGPVQFDLIAEETRKSNLDIDALFDDGYRFPEPPAKKRKLTRELSQESFPPFESNESVEQVPGRVSTGNAHQASKAMSPVVYIPPYSRTASVYHSPYGPPASVYESPYSFATPAEAGSRSASLQSVRPSAEAAASVGVVEKLNLPADLRDEQSPIVDLREASTQASRVTRAAKEPSLLADVQEEQPPAMDLPDEAISVQMSEDFDDDGSLFGDYVSTREDSIECSPITEPSFVAEKEEVELHAPESSTIPAVSYGPDVPIPSVERELPSSKYYHTFQIPHFNNTAPKFSIRPGVFKLDQIVTQSFSTRSLPNLVGQPQNGASPSERYQSQANKSSTLPYCRPSLPLAICLALARSDDLHSLKQTIESFRRTSALQRSSLTLPNSTPAHQTPPQLEKLLNSLALKFNSDKAFQKSVISWLIAKMADSDEEPGDLFDDVGNINRLINSKKDQPREELEKAMFNEYLEHILEVKEIGKQLSYHYDALQKAYKDIDQARSEAEYWYNKYANDSSQPDTPINEQNALQHENHMLMAKIARLEAENNNLKSVTPIRSSPMSMDALSPAAPDNTPTPARKLLFTKETGVAQGVLPTRPAKRARKSSEMDG